MPAATWPTGRLPRPQPTSAGDPCCAHLPTSRLIRDRPVRRGIRKFMNKSSRLRNLLMCREWSGGRGAAVSAPVPGQAGPGEAGTARLHMTHSSGGDRCEQVGVSLRPAGTRMHGSFRRAAQGLTWLQVPATRTDQTPLMTDFGTGHGVVQHASL